jgi:hypothetical protein
MALIGIITYALFIFWIGGIVSIFIDSDHIFGLIGRKPSFKFSETYGRPFHTRTIFILVAYVISFFMGTFIYGFYKGILLGIGDGETLLLMLGLNIFTYLGSKYLGNKFFLRLIEQRKKWRKEKNEQK